MKTCDILSLNSISKLSLNQEKTDGDTLKPFPKSHLENNPI